MPNRPVIDRPGLYHLSADEYHSDPCALPSLSRSVLKQIVARTPRHGWAAHCRLNPKYDKTQHRKFDMGQLAMAYMAGLEEYVEVIDYNDYRTKDAREQRERALENNLYPALPKEAEVAQEMARVCRLQLNMHDTAYDAFVPGRGVAELTGVWKEGSTFMRMRMDWMPAPAESHVTIYDYKVTTAADPEAWVRNVAVHTGCHLQEAFYCRGLPQIMPNVIDANMLFIVQEQEFPYAVSVIGLGQETKKRASELVEEGIETWNYCTERGIWPAYSRSTYWMEAPPYILRDWELRRYSRRPTAEMIQASVDWQRPAIEAPEEDASE